MRNGEESQPLLIAGALRPPTFDNTTCARNLHDTEDRHCKTVEVLLAQGHLNKSLPEVGGQGAPQRIPCRAPLTCTAGRAGLTKVAHTPDVSQVPVSSSVSHKPIAPRPLPYPSPLRGFCIWRVL